MKRCLAWPIIVAFVLSGCGPKSNGFQCPSNGGCSAAVPATAPTSASVPIEREPEPRLPEVHPAGV